MLSDYLVGEDLLAMQKEKGNICISIVIPTHKLSPERRTDQPRLERAIENARELLHYKFPDSDLKPLEKSMEELMDAVDFNHNSEGLGLYISSHLKMMVQYPFPVKEKVLVGDSFEVRDLLYKVNLSHPYFLLQLNQQEARLFQGQLDQFAEIRDHNFPLKYEEEYLYNPPSRSSSYAGQSHVKSFERDKSVVEATRFGDFFQQADDLLGRYLVGNTPFIVMGVEKEISWFREASRHNNLLVDEINGNYQHAGLKELADLCWPLIQEKYQHDTEELIAEFEEKIGAHLALTGIEEIWQAAAEGRAFHLLVEMDLRLPGFVETETGKFHLRPPHRSHRIITDAVDDLIEMVLEKNGEVHFTENGRLENYQGIALITRY